LAAYLSNVIDDIPFAQNPRQDTIPEGPIPTTNDTRIMEAYLSYHLLGHEVSIGKSDHWIREELEARAGIEPAHKGFADLSLTTWVPRLGRVALSCGSFQTALFSAANPCCGEADWSGRRDLNSRPSPWQGDALPLSYSRFKRLSGSGDFPQPGRFFDCEKGARVQPISPSCKGWKPL
jgi:hypothetical protein